MPGSVTIVTEFQLLWFNGRQVMFCWRSYSTSCVKNTFDIRRATSQN